MRGGSFGGRAFARNSARDSRSLQVAREIIMAAADSKLTRIGIFYDGNFFFHISNYYNYHHERRSRISVGGFHAFIRDEAAKYEGTDTRYCQIVDAHYF